MSSNSDLLILFIVIAPRLFVPLAIPRYPIPAGIAALVIDGVDQTVFQTFTTLPLAGYQGYDKALDIYYLSVEYLSTLRNWANLDALPMSQFLFYFRLMGVLLFELTHLSALLLFFPNTFEYFFLFYEAVRLRWNPKRMSHRCCRRRLLHLGLHQGPAGVLDPHRATRRHRHDQARDLRRADRY